MKRGRKPTTRSIKDRFWDKVIINPKNDCWEWKKSKKGRLLFCVQIDGKLNVFMSRRYAWDIEGFPEIPKGRELWNICGNDLCVNPEHQMINTLENRFWASIENKSISGADCWEWVKGKDEKGYGGIFESGRGRIKSHRLSWEINVGEIPEGFHVLHKCDNPSCVNPAHLWLGTHQDNMKDSKEKGRRPMGEDNVRSKLSVQEVKTIRKLRKDGMKYSELAKMFNVSRQTIPDIINGRCWSWLE